MGSVSEHDCNDQEFQVIVTTVSGSYRLEWCGYADNPSDALNQALTQREEEWILENMGRAKAEQLGYESRTQPGIRL